MKSFEIGEVEQQNSLRPNQPRKEPKPGPASLHTEEYHQLLSNDLLPTTTVEMLLVRNTTKKLYNRSGPFSPSFVCQKTITCDGIFRPTFDDVIRISNWFGQIGQDSLGLSRKGSKGTEKIFVATRFPRRLARETLTNHVWYYRSFAF